MLKITHSYEHISKEIIENPCLNNQMVLNRMMDELPQTPWVDIKILEWETSDNKLPIEYYSYKSVFGEVLVANTPNGVCYLGLLNSEIADVLGDLKSRFKHTNPIEMETPQQKQAVDFLNGEKGECLQFHLKGTPYQTEIWRKLIRIPYGKVISYATLGGSAEYSRAAGTANGRNPIFWIIPCHRAVKTTGGFDRYFWGEDVKKRLLAWEFANTSI